MLSQFLLRILSPRACISCKIVIEIRPLSVCGVTAELASMIELARKKKAYQQATSGSKLLKLKKKSKPSVPALSDVDSLKDQLSVSKSQSLSYPTNTVFCAGLYWEDVPLPQTWEGNSCAFLSCSAHSDKERLLLQPYA